MNTITITSTINNVSYIANVESATILEALREARQKGVISCMSDEELTEHVVSYNGANAAPISDLFDQIYVADSDKIEFDAPLTPINVPATATEDENKDIKVTVVSAGGLTEKHVTVKAGTTVVDVCIKEKAMLGMEENDIKTADKFVNDVAVNNDYKVKENDVINTAVKCAGTKGAEISINYNVVGADDSDIADGTFKVTGGLLNLPAGKIIEMIAATAAHGQCAIRSVDFDGAYMNTESSLYKRATEAPFAEDAAICIYLAEDVEPAADHEAEEDLDADDTDDTHATDDITVVLPGGFDNTTEPWTEGITVADVVTMPRILAMTALNREQALQLKYFVNDVEVNNDYPLSQGDTITMSARTAGTKG